MAPETPPSKHTVAPSPAHPGPSVSKPQAAAKRPLILLVEDEPLLRKSVQRILWAAGYAVECAANGREALDLLRAQNFALMLLDLNLPDMSGQQILDAVVRQDIPTAVVIHSGESTFEQASQSMRKGAKDFLAKPCLPEVLLDTVARTLERQERHLVYLRIQKRMQTSPELHRFLIHHSPDLIFMLDEQGRLCFVNQRGQQYLGADIESLLGRHFLDFMTPEDHFKAKQAFERHRKRERPGVPVELRLQPLNGDAVRHVEVWAHPVRMFEREDSEEPTSGQPLLGSYGIARDIHDRKQAEELRRYHLHHDQLTNLPNRSLFHDRLQMALRQAHRQEHKLAVMFMDLDRFKLINDSYGHLVGDELLQMVAQRLKSSLRECDTLARISGDEFNLLLPQIKQAGDATTIGHKIQALFREPFVVQGHSICVTLSIGCAVYPDHGESKEGLLRHADAAMYRVKERGRDGFCCYAPEMGESLGHHLALERSLHQALVHEQFCLYYQPQIAMPTGKVMGLEALIRWKHPQRGLLLPAEFLSVAEQTGLSHRIGEWVIGQVCRDMTVLRQQGYADLRIAINVSPQQLDHEGFEHKLIGTIRAHGLDPSFLDIEITENSLILDMHKSMQSLLTLCEQGVTITVDDFGKGYSSLSYLHTLPLTTLKIDRGFVKNLSPNSADPTIIRAILAIAKGLQLNFIAEGVETGFQHDYLLAEGCRMAQGHYYAPALSLDAALAYLASRHPKPPSSA